MDIKQVGVSYEANEIFDNYNITGKIEKFINSNQFNASFKLKEADKLVLELYYTPGVNEGRYTINYFFEDENKMKQYQNILFDFVSEVLNNIPNN